MNYSIVALLPIKAHSERIAKKNFRNLCGKPLFRWVLETLLSLREISAVVINTDARSILLDHGLEESDRVVIRDRKPAICGDMVNMNLVIADDIAAIEADLYLMTHTTNPLLSATTVKDAVREFEDKRSRGFCDSLFSVNRFQSRFYLQGGKPMNHDPTLLMRTQDLVPLYEENSNLYVFTRESFTATRARIGARPLMFETPFRESIDIDDQESWDLAALIMAARGDA